MTSTNNAVAPVPATRYRASPINRSPRRTKPEIEEIRTAIFNVLDDDNPMTVRQVFYQLVSRGVIAKTEAEYKQTVTRLLRDMRMSGDVPFIWITDYTRYMRKPRSHSGLEDALSYTAQTYRRSVWDECDDYVEVWLEKEALAGVIYEETEVWVVPLMVTRGYASLSFLYDAAQAIIAERKPTFIYFLGDWDPSGVNISQDVEIRLRKLAPNAEIHFERLAVTREQVALWELPTRPTKDTDSRTKSWDGGGSVEVDAIPASVLRDLVRECIERHVDWQTLSTLEATEDAERDVLLKIINGMQPNQSDGPS